MNGITVVTKDARRKANGHHSLVVWLTGLSGAGKTTLATRLCHELHARGIHAYMLDGDVLRAGLNKDLGFQAADRAENIRRIAETAKLMVDAGIVVFVSSISPFYKDRAAARQLFARGEFYEIYVRCPLAQCEQRDVKGLYRLARLGQIENFTGLTQAYEEPVNPDCTVDTNVQTVDEAAHHVSQYLDHWLLL